MKPQFTVDGIEIQTFTEIFDTLVTEYKRIYGADIDLSQNTPDGQKVGIEAELEYDLQSFALALYNQFDPDFASGEMLNKIIKLIGITRNPATRSSAAVTITTDRILTLATGYTVADENGQNWVTTSGEVLALGANIVTMYSEEWGKVEALLNTINSPVTIVLGVISATNPADAIPGVDEETDAALRTRRNKSLENASYSTVGGLYAKLANIEGVTDLQVYENDTGTAGQLKDPTTGSYVASVGMPIHSIWCVIQGGTVADIAETIAKNKTSGADMRGVETTTYLETLIRPDGSTFYYTHSLEYDRPTEIPLYINLTVTRKDAGVAIDLDLIKEKLVSKLYGIHENSQANELYGYVYQAGTNFIASVLEISLDDITYTDGQLLSDFDEILLIETANITITEVV
ncbi:baseplate J/gp47 family protein [Sulfurovum sp.]|uniref:baseplate J/gp47 family protein n=1 Tax=Sulfurovum sp. TaxID=1969726 RepID=UPI0035690F3B